MSAVDPLKIQALGELQRRRDTLSATQQQALDELSSRFGLAEGPREPQQTTPADTRTAGQVALDQAKNVAYGIPQAITGIPSTIAGALKTGLEQYSGGYFFPGATKQLTQGIIAPFKPLAETITGNPPPPQSPEWVTAAQGAGAMLGSALLPKVTSAIANKAAPIVGKAAAPVAAPRLEAIRTRAIQSILKPDKASFDFGADPVKEVANLPPAASIKGMQKNVRDAITAKEAQLQQAAANPTNPPTDVEPIIRAQVDSIRNQLQRWGGKAQKVDKAIDAYIEDLRNRYGTTVLDPLQVIAEKRFLNKEIKFNPSDIRGQTLNAIKLKTYRGLDNAFDYMVPSGKEINQSYAGLIEGDHLLKQRALERGNAPLTGHTMFETVTKHMPEIAAKTGVSAALKSSSGTRPTTAGQYLRKITIPVQQEEEQ